MASRSIVTYCPQVWHTVYTQDHGIKGKQSRKKHVVHSIEITPEAQLPGFASHVPVVCTMSSATE